MESEFERQFGALPLDVATRAKIKRIVESAGKEFPCLSCPSKDECNSFKWFTKWFGENVLRRS